jgi:hypothetical protein
LEPAKDLAGTEGDAMALHQHGIDTGGHGGVGEQQGPPAVHLVVRDEQRLGRRCFHGRSIPDSRAGTVVCSRTHLLLWWRTTSRLPLVEVANHQRVLLMTTVKHTNFFLGVSILS